MPDESIRLSTGQVITGRLVCHLGSGRVEVDVDGRRYAGRKVSSGPRSVAQVAADWQAAAARVSRKLAESWPE